MARRSRPHRRARRGTHSSRSRPAKSRSFVGSSSRNTSKRREQDRRERRARRLPARQHRGHRTSSSARRQTDVGDTSRRRGRRSRGHRARGTARAHPRTRRRRPARSRASASVAASKAGIASVTPVRRPRNARSVSPARRSGSWGKKPTVAAGGPRVTVPRSASARRRASAAASTSRRRCGPTTPRRLRGPIVRDTPSRITASARRKVGTCATRRAHQGSAAVAPPDDPQSRPHVVDRAHLVVDEPEGQRDLAHRVLGDVGRHAGRLLRPRDPDAPVGEDRLAARLDPLRELAPSR